MSQASRDDDDDDEEEEEEEEEEMVLRAAEASRMESWTCPRSSSETAAYMLLPG